MIQKMRSTISHVFEEISANVAEHGQLGASGGTVDVLVASEVEAEIDFDYLPGLPAKLSGPPEDCYPVEPAEIRFHSIKSSAPFVFDGEDLALHVGKGYDLTKFLSERDIEALEEMIIERAEAK